MTNRRRHPRHQVPAPADAVLQILRAATVTQVGSRDFVCVGGGRLGVGEDLTLHLVGEDARASIRATVSSTRPVPHEGTLRNEVQLRARGEVIVQHFAAGSGQGGDEQ